MHSPGPPRAFVLVGSPAAASEAVGRSGPADPAAALAAITRRLQGLRGAGDGAHLPEVDSLLECARVLGALHATLAGEQERRLRLERELLDAHTALAQAGADLAGLRDGERSARHAAYHDALTSLPNRRHFRERLQQALAAPMPQRATLAVLYIDLDEFKPVNDLHGHATGDELLRIVAMRLVRALRAEDMVSRLGGDEFACLIADMRDPAALARIAGKIIDVVSAPVAVGALELQVRPSIGIAVSPPDASGADALLRRADAAMYRAKRSKTGVAHFDALLDDPHRISVPSPPD